jgi:hypothetical protein
MELSVKAICGQHHLKIYVETTEKSAVETIYGTIG